MSVDKMAKKLEETLGIANEIIQESETHGIAIPQQELGEGSIPSIDLEEDMAHDYIRARETLRMLIKKGETALTGIITVANSSDHPRAFEVVATLMKTISDASMQLLELQKQIRELKSDSSHKDKNKPQQTTVEAGGTVNNIVVFDSTAALSEQLKELQAAGQFTRPVPK